MARDSFVFYRSFFESLRLMPPEVQAEVYPAIVEYGLNGKEPKGLSDIARGVFILIKPNIDATIARKENGKRFGKLGGRPKKDNTTPSPTPNKDTLTLEQEISEMQTDQQWSETICMQFHITHNDLPQRLEAFRNFCKCNDKSHESLSDAKRHFYNWMLKAYPQKEFKELDQLPPPSYEFNGGFDSQDV